MLRILETICSPLGPERIPAGAVMKVKQEIEVRELLVRLTAAGLVVSGANNSLNCLDVDVDDDIGEGMPILVAQWTSECTVVRVGANAMIERAYIMDGLGRYETPTDGVVWPPNAAEKGMGSPICGSKLTMMKVIRSSLPSRHRGSVRTRRIRPAIRLASRPSFSPPDHDGW